jgi:hypothetical protein
MAKKKTKKKKTVKKPTTKRKTRKTPTKKRQTKKKSAERKPAKRQTPAKAELEQMPAGRQSIKPFEVCNYFGVYLREIFEKEHSRNRAVHLGEVFGCLISDLNGAWNLVKLYGPETPLEKLRGESNPYHYDR